ncbi:MAG TPA: glycosyltransferase [Nitrososphaera sp.]|jgi:cellulose synthase/poly-beta-1,6-N-acetylglucosamine synthase-like glycosyltransferase|nr:glycosyltransferase [Nitrososphaera sp.]
MEHALTIGNLVLAAIMAGIFGVWMYFLTYMTKSFWQSPMLESFDRTRVSHFPKVSVILPARNERRYITRCLNSLLGQDYPNFEIIAINDSSTDGTGEIMKAYAANDLRVMHIDASPKPEGWTGKNWACYQGFLQARGELLMFTDADSKHLPSTMSLAVGHLISENLEALTAVPRLICNDFWTKITLPILATFLHTRFSPIRVNDPNSKTGYFFGSFFIITRNTYEAIGTHEGVKEELVEDGALGGKVKASKFRMKMVRGEFHIDAVWARDLPTLWQGLRRFMIPVYYQDKVDAYMMAMAVFFILFAPFASLPYLSVASFAGNISFQMLFGLQISAIALIMVTTAVQCRLAIFESPMYAFAAPLSGALISLSFMSAIADAKKKGAVSWRGRKYAISKTQNPVS